MKRGIFSSFCSASTFSNAGSCGTAQYGAIDEHIFSLITKHWMLELCTSGCGWSVYRNIRWGPEKPHRMSWGVKVLTVSEQWIHKWKETMFKVLNKPSCIIFSVIDLSCMYAVFHQAFLCNTLFMRCKFYTHSDMDHKTIGF